MVSFGAAASVALSMVGASFAEGANGLVGPPTLVDDTKRNAGAFRTARRVGSAAKQPGTRSLAWRLPRMRLARWIRAPKRR